MGTISRLEQKTKFKGDFNKLPQTNKGKSGQFVSPEFNSLYGVDLGVNGIQANQVPQEAVNNGDRMINGNLIIKGTVTAGKISVGEQNIVSSVAFTTPYADECDWTAGYIQALTGTKIAINSGTTGRLQAVTTPWETTGALGLWHMDEVAGTTLDNAEGDANWDISLTGASVNQTGKFTKSVLFDGVNDYGSIADYSEMDQTTFTWEGWFKTTGDVTSNQYLISRSYSSGSSTDRYFDLYINSNGFLTGVVYGYSTTYTPYTVSSTFAVDDTAWHQFAVIFDAGADTLTLIVDGIRHDLLTGCTTNPRASAQPIYFCKSDLSTAGFYGGLLDEVRFSASARVYSASSQLFIYYDSKVGADLQVTTDRFSAVGDTKVLLCIMTPQLSGSGATLELIRREGTVISGDSIRTGKIQSTDGKTYFDLDGRRLVVNDEAGFDRIILGKFF